MMNELFFILFGYCFGSVLFARLFGRLFGHEDITAGTRDQNPGTANAFLQGGFFCGTLTLLGDIFKGFFPVWLYLSRYSEPPSAFWLGLILAAPVLGHIFPMCYHFKGGKGIATTFGCLLALLPDAVPLLTLAFYFIFFSLILRISPHFYRTIITYLISFFSLCLFPVHPGVRLGFLFITGGVCLRFSLSQETKERCQINLLWMR